MTVGPNSLFDNVFKNSNNQSSAATSLLTYKHEYIPSSLTSDVMNNCSNSTVVRLYSRTVSALDTRVKVQKGTTSAFGHNVAIVDRAKYVDGIVGRDISSRIHTCR